MPLYQAVIGSNNLKTLVMNKYSVAITFIVPTLSDKFYSLTINNHVRTWCLLLIQILEQTAKLSFLQRPKLHFLII